MTIIGLNADLGGRLLLPDDDIVNTPCDTWDVDSRSSDMIYTIGANLPLRYNAFTWQNRNMGFPYMVVDNSQPFIPVTYNIYKAFPGLMPLHPNTPIQTTNDRIVLCYNIDTNTSYELWRAYNHTSYWLAGGGGSFDLNQQTSSYVKGHTSVSAAGLPIFPSLVRYDEILAGEINHALAFISAKIKMSYVFPAIRSLKLPYQPASMNNFFPMGVRVRLNANFDISGFQPQAKIVATALKKYGMILNDGGPNEWALRCFTVDNRWVESDLADLKKIKGRNLEILKFGTEIQWDPKNP